MFAVLNTTGTLNSNAPGVIDSNLAIAVREQNSTIANLEKQRAEQAAAGAPVDVVDRKIASAKSDLAQLEKVRKNGFSTKASLDGDAPAWARDLIGKAQKNPELVVYKVQDAASKFSWLLIPISVPFLWLLFPLRRRYKTYDHAVFVTYSLSFMMLVVVAGGLLVAAGLPGLASLLFFVPPFHMYRHLKGAYELGRFSALARTVALVTFAFVAAGLFVAAAAAIGMM